MTPSRAISHLRDYVAIPSVNPMGRDDIPSAVAGERRYAEHLGNALRRLDLDAAVIGSGSRASVIAEATSRDASETVLVASHLDTVPVDGMEIDPFDPVLRDGRLYGRGSCDTKAGMAALVDALETVLQRGTLRRNLILVGEADEEYGSCGVGDVLDQLGGRRPDWALVTEPTELRTVTHHKGIALIRLAAHGRACHSSDPSAGANAIVALARAITSLDQLAAELAERRDPHLGPATLSIGLAAGGHAPNIVPDRAWLLADRRLLPGEDAPRIQTEIEARLAADAVADVAVESCHVAKPPLATPDDHPAVAACREAWEAETSATHSVAFGTDAGLFAERGIPSIVMGPGSIAQAHTAREFVATDEVETMTRFFLRLLSG